MAKYELPKHLPNAVIDVALSPLYNYKEFTVYLCTKQVGLGEVIAKMNKEQLKATIKHFQEALNEYEEYHKKKGTKE